MDILKQFEGKINSTLETFGRVMINSYLQQLHNFRLFLYYLIQKNVLLKDFDSFAKKQTDTLCSYRLINVADYSSVLNGYNLLRHPCCFKIMSHHDQGLSKFFRAFNQKLQRLQRSLLIQVSGWLIRKYNLRL